MAEASSNANYIVQRLKHWQSRRDRESYPGWLNPRHLSMEDIQTLSKLAGGKSALRLETIDAAVRAGTIIYIVREGRTDGGIIAFAAMNIVYTLNEARAIVTQMCSPYPHLPKNIGLEEALRLAAQEAGAIQVSIPNGKVRGEIERAELFDGLFEHH